ncbi:alpha,alpha-phosphotrehalase [Bombilactobacillus folatiphilus]|uniref:Alpha,alpha-phosphotrehalase n=1 Tax=Bombilactobacillus folatiphilus TaxID=2923362 RepID=A0ABY4P8C1_9LACO|nr:alpha,alpha-phosphotrehalase [Bombilactobacillus folatiphilus]UQS81893.1 alpha,alpha-phosphotrehalase [Bombilactobacillus folatiphilus]
MNWHDKVVYQIYPKSFYDSNNDGIGDLQGIIAKMDYLKQLHIDYIWFNPFFISPQYDSGYDVADYCQIDPKFGTMADFEELVALLKEQQIGVMLDMVFNHTSTHHEWFQKALAGDTKYQDYYYIRPPKANGALPNNWQSKFGGNAWAPFGETGNYYLHLYDPHQADLNWHNPHVRQELAQIVNFWRQKGINAFRFDVLNVIGKSLDLKSAPPGQSGKMMYTDTPLVQPWIQELAQNSFDQAPAALTVGEMSSTTIPSAKAYTDPNNHELSMVFQFHHLKTDYQNGQKWTNVPYDFHQLRQIFHQWGQGLQPQGWQALFWNNHDQPWAINRFGSAKQYRVKSAQMLAACMHLNRGTPYIYMGEEIGMIDPDYHSMDDYVDIEAHNAYQALLQQGKSPREAFAIIKTKARDNSRTPMHWDDSAQAGFTKGTPWLKVTNQAQINVEAELQHGQIFPFYQRLIALRKQYRLIQDGDYQPFGQEIDWLYAYQRSLDNEQLLVLNNFADHEIQVALPAPWLKAAILITNEPKIKLQATLTLKAFTTLALFKQEED